MALSETRAGSEDRNRSRIVAGLEAALDVIALMLLPLMTLVPHAVAPLAAVAGLCAIGLALGINPHPQRQFLVSAVILGALMLWCTLSAAIWSIDLTSSLALAARVGALLVASFALVLAADIVAAPRRLTAFLLAGAAIGILMAAIDCQTGGGLHQLVSIRSFRPQQLDDLAVALAILVLPAGAMLVCDGRVALAFLAVAAMVVTICALDDTAAKMTLAAGVPVAALMYFRRRATVRAAAFLSVIAIVAAPMILPRLAHSPALFHTADSFKQSAAHRLLIWSFVGDRITEHPIIGWGFDSSRAIPGGKMEVRPSQTALPLHPHDAALQLWLELGFPGATLFAAFIGFLWYRLDAAPWPRIYTAAAGGALSAALLGSLLTYGIWEEWWLGTQGLILFAVLVMGLVAAADEPQPATRSESPAARLTKSSGPEKSKAL